MNVGQNIKRIREEKHLSQKDLADSLGLTPSAINHYESGRRTASLEVLIDIAHELGVSLSDLAEEPVTRKRYDTETDKLARRIGQLSPESKKWIKRQLILEEEHGAKLGRKRKSAKVKSDPKK